MGEATSCCARSKLKRREVTFSMAVGVESECEERVLESSVVKSSTVKIFQQTLSL